MSKWEPIRLRRVCRINPPVPEFDALPPESVVTFVPLEAVWPGALDVSRSLPRGQVTDGYTRFLERDVLLPKITPTFEAARAAIASGLANGVGCGTTELHVLRPGPRLDERFLFYAVQTSFFLQQGKGHMFGVAGQKRVPEQFVTDYKLDLPPIEEQRAIVRFLDEQTAKIDALVEAKGLLRQRLAEERAALIDDVVTGSHFLPDRVPPGWAMWRNKTLFSEVNEPSEADLELLTVSHLTGVTPRSEKHVYMFLAESFEDYKACRPGDLVINTMWAWMGAAGVSRTRGIVSPSYAVYRPLQGAPVLSAFLDYVIRSRFYVGMMSAHSEGVWRSRLRLYSDEFLRMPFPLPPLDEQRRIVLDLDNCLEANRCLEATLHDSIVRLQEYRAALITAAVTGQIDVTKAG